MANPKGAPQAPRPGGADASPGGMARDMRDVTAARACLVAADLTEQRLLDLNARLTQVQDTLGRVAEAQNDCGFQLEAMAREIRTMGVAVAEVAVAESDPASAPLVAVEALRQDLGDLGMRIGSQIAAAIDQDRAIRDSEVVARLDALESAQHGPAILTEIGAMRRDVRTLTPETPVITQQIGTVSEGLDTVRQELASLAKTVGTNTAIARDTTLQRRQFTQLLMAMEGLAKMTRDLHGQTAARCAPPEGIPADPASGTAEQALLRALARLRTHGQAGHGQEWAAAQEVHARELRIALAELLAQDMPRAMAAQRTDPSETA